MSEEMQIEGKSYISSKRAAELSRYAQDYIGQLARKGLIDARRIGGLWYVSMESLEAYKTKAEAYKPIPPGNPTTPEPGTLIFFDGKEYLSAARAAEQTGYTQDYVGQLARSGTISSRQVGNRWYVERDSIVTHRKEKDALLANVQREAVGLERREEAKVTQPEYLVNTSDFGRQPLLRYYAEDKDLLPTTGKIRSLETKGEDVSVLSVETTSIPILRLQKPIQHAPVVITRPKVAHATLAIPKSSNLPMLLGAVATIVIVLSVGYTSVLRQNSVYATSILPKNEQMQSLSATASAVFASIGDALEPLLTHELVYVRSTQTQ